MKNKQIRRLVLFIGVACVATLGACKKDSETKSVDIVGVWIGEEARVTEYADNGTDIVQETIVTLQSPNYAKAVFHADGTFSVDLRLEKPTVLNEHQEGTYTLEGTTLTLYIEGQDSMTVPLIKHGDTLEVTLGTAGEITLTYTFRRE